MQMDSQTQIEREIEIEKERDGSLHRALNRVKRVFLE